MKIKLLFIVFITCGLIGGCNTAESKTPDIATDMCGCFNLLKDSLPAEGIKVFEKAATSATPQETFTTEMKSIPVEIAQKVNAALMSTAKDGSPVNDCLKEIDKKYKTPTNDEQVMAQKMVDALKDKKGCEIMLALMRMNLKK
jgi:ABC-type phosphate/phosphonate transport system substrate-binding protein